MKTRTLAVHAGDLHQIDPLLEQIRKAGVRVERRDRQIRDLFTDDVHLIWGMPHPYDIHKQLACFPNVFFMEQGWLPQRDGAYIDSKGYGPDSTLACHPSLPVPRLDLIDKIEALHRRVSVEAAKEEDVGGAGYVFVPLQLRTDRSVQLWSWVAQLEMLEKVCELCPDERIVVRSHPQDGLLFYEARRDSRIVAAHKGIEERKDGNSYQWCKYARMVVGINSTVLLEALTFHKPVCALGKGVFSGNGVMWECGGNDGRLEQFLRGNYVPDAGKIDCFLTLLLERQIPYNTSVAEFAGYPALREMLEVAGCLI